MPFPFCVLFYVIYTVEKVLLNKLESKHPYICDQMHFFVIFTITEEWKLFLCLISIP